MTAHTSAPEAQPTWIVCEDGDEYLQRFRRFLPTCAYQRATSARTVMALIAQGHVSGIILDMDFRRAADDDLIDEEGASAQSLSAGRKRELVSRQGLLILRHLRAGGIKTPAILCTDLDDAQQVAFLEQTLAPLRIAPSNTGMDRFAAWMIVP